jgi:outer membrane translocation and assembly module TamA
VHNKVTFGSEFASSIRTALIRGVLLGAMFGLATTSGVGQTAAGIHLVDVRFRGDTQPEAVDLMKCAADLESRLYEGPEWLSNITERVRLQCLQDNGYFKAVVKPSSRQLPDKHGTHQFVITFDILAGPQYRTGQVGFSNNHIFSAEELRSMFKVASGDVFSPAKIRQGLDQMHSAYVERRYLDFTSVPDATIDDVHHVIGLVIALEEGKQFR